MMLLGSFSLPKLSNYNEGRVQSKSTGLRKNGYIAWHEISFMKWLQRMNQMLAVKVTNYVIYGDPIYTDEYVKEFKNRY